MIRKTGRLLAVTAVFLIVLSCREFYVSPFPQVAPFIEIQADISEVLPFDDSAEYRIHCVDDGTTEYVVLLARGGTTGERLVILNENLAVLYAETDTTDDLFRIFSPVVSNGAGEVFVGLLAFPPGLGTPATLAANNLFWERTLYDSTTDEVISVNTVGNQVEFDWIPASPEGARTGELMDLDLAGSSYYTMDTGYSIRSGVAAMAAFDDINETVAGFIGTTATIRANNLVAATELVSSIGGFEFAVDGPVGQIQVAMTGVVLQTEDRGVNLTYYDYAGREGPGIYFDRGDIRVVFSVAGEHFYIFDRERELLVKARTWW